MFGNVTALLSQLTGNPRNVQRGQQAAARMLRSVLDGGFKWPLILGMLLIAAATALECWMTVAFRNALRAMTDPSWMDPAGAWFWLWTLLGLGFGAFLASRVQEALNVSLVPRLSAHLQKDQFDQLLQLSPAMLARKNSGEVAQAIKGAAGSFLGLVQLATFDLVKVCVGTVSIAAILFQANPTYSLIVLGWLAVFALGSALLARRCFSLGFAAYMASGAVAGELGDTILNFESIFNFASFGHERRRMGASLSEESTRSQHLMRYILWMRIFAGFAAFLLLAVMMISAFRAVLAGRQSVAFFVLAFSTTSVLVGAVFDLSRQLLGAYANIGTLYGSLATVADLEPLPDRSTTAPPLRSTAGQVAFRNVRFGFPGEELLFKDFSLEIRAGERVGLVGPSGAGKTTLLRLLLSHLPLQSGSIEIDGQDISTVSLSSLQEKIAAVSQVPNLFNRSLRDNIGYGRPDLPHEEIVRVGKQTRLHEMITRRGGGYDDFAGQFGWNLSGGERQRVSIARAMLKESASIILLDEATSALDSESEREIQEMLSRVFQGRTVLAIAHRLSTVRQMDRIIFLDRGVILEQGTHEQLLAARGRYARLCSLQEGQQHLRARA